VLHRQAQGVPAANKIGKQLQVFVRENNVDQALRILKKKMQREGIFREMKRRKAYEKPSERKTREKAEAIRRARKAARKQAQREGLIPAPKRLDDKRARFGGRGGFGSGEGGQRKPGQASLSALEKSSSVVVQSWPRY
jgi:small subunit ribosomal protein S21